MTKQLIVSAHIFDALRKADLLVQDIKATESAGWPIYGQETTIDDEDLVECTLKSGHTIIDTAARADRAIAALATALGVTL